MIDKPRGREATIDLHAPIPLRQSHHIGFTGSNPLSFA